MEEEIKTVPGLEIRYTELTDGKHLSEWLHQPGVLRWFPMYDDVEIDDAVGRWVGFARYKCSLTAVLNGVPAGMATLYLNPYKKLAHQCEFGIIVGDPNRGIGIGTQLLQGVINLARERFGIELLHLTVYESNPAIRLYERFGFKEFGRQTHWIKEQDGYRGRIFMEKYLKDIKK